MGKPAFSNPRFSHRWVFLNIHKNYELNHFLLHVDYRHGLWEVWPKISYVASQNYHREILGKKKVDGKESKE